MTRRCCCSPDIGFCTIKINIFKVDRYVVGDFEGDFFFFASRMIRYEGRHFEWPCDRWRCPWSYHIKVSLRRFGRCFAFFISGRKKFALKKLDRAQRSLMNFKESWWNLSALQNLRKSLTRSLINAKRHINKPSQLFALLREAAHFFDNCFGIFLENK